MNVLIAAPIHDVLRKGLEEQGYHLEYALDISQASSKRIVQDVTGIITSTRLHLDKAWLDAAPQLKWIGRMGSGMEVIDVVYAEEKGIKCFSSPEGNCNAVGEHALGMLLSLTKKIVVSNAEVKDHKWLREENRGMELEGKTIGIIGYGHTGKALAKKLSGFDMQILVYDKHKHGEENGEVGFCQDMDPIYTHADIVSFHVPLQPDTHHYFNAVFLDSMKKNFIVINTSRGTVIDSDALIRGLESKKIIGACLDVFEQEPLSQMDAAVKTKFTYISSLPNVVVTPHIAGYTHEALYKMSKTLLEKIVMYV